MSKEKKVRNTGKRDRARFSWMQAALLIIAMLAIGVATIYTSRIIDGNGDHFDWFMAVVLVIIAVSNIKTEAYHENRLLQRPCGL